LTTTLPHWDMTPLFPSLESEEFNLALKQLGERIEDLQSLYDKLGVRAGEKQELTETLVAAVEEVIEAGNALSEDMRTVGSFIGSFVAVNSKDALAQAKYSEFQIKLVPAGKLAKRFNAWVGSLDVEKLIETSPLARDHAFSLRKAAKAAQHLMSEAEEDLYSELTPSGSTAWGRLHSNISSRLLVSVEGKPEKLPMAAVRGLAHDPDPGVRRAAYDAELAAWESVEVPMAAALNSIKADSNTVNARRGWADSLGAALFNNNIDKTSLDAMQQAVVESFPDFRRYLKAKAKLLGKPALAWYDLFAPVGTGDGRKWTWDRATDFIVEQFGTYSPKMQAMGARAFTEQWIDAEPREGKADGAFCMGVRKDESRVMMNYSDSFDSVQTLAHELGHAYHNVNLSDRTPMQRTTPMALAETASIFCQAIIVQAGLVQASEQESLTILESELQNACQVVVDIHSRFLFEKAVFDGRAKRELSVGELKGLMLDAQRETYGDGLDPNALHPYMWAVKGHYYGATYYNWPYTFGLLFSTGLYAQYTEDPEKFKAGYDALLSSTGMEDAASLTARFGFDIAAPEFWRSSLDILRGRIDQFEKLVS